MFLFFLSLSRNELKVDDEINISSFTISSLLRGVRAKRNLGSDLPWDETAEAASVAYWALIY